MPFSYTLNDAEGMVRMVGAGEASLAETEQMVRALASDLRSRPGQPLFCDVRELDWVPWPNEVKIVASLLYELRSSFTGPVAIVTEKPAIFGMARMLSMLVEPAGIRMAAFRCPAQAKLWCGQALEAG